MGQLDKGVLLHWKSKKWHYTAYAIASSAKKNKTKQKHPHQLKKLDLNIISVL